MTLCLRLAPKGFTPSGLPQKYRQKKGQSQLMVKFDGYGMGEIGHNRGGPEGGISKRSPWTRCSAIR